MTEDDYTSALLKFVGAEFQRGDERATLDERTPLIEAGVLDSLRIAVLLGFIRDELCLYVPLARIDAENFADVRTIARMLTEVAGSAA
jgi:clorobiocin biosynthesis protein CloN5